MTPGKEFARTELLLGSDALAKLAAARVVVLGLGGVGSSCAEALGRGGIGSLVLVDRDVVDITNINRQALAFHSTIGKSKVEVMADMLKDINPTCHIETHQCFLDKDQIEDQLTSFGPCDYVVDAIDTLSQKLKIAQFCEGRSIPLISAMGGANKLDPTRLRFSDIYETHDCSLSRIMRKECKKRGIRSLEVLFSPEKPQEVPGQKDVTPGIRPAKAESLGTMSYYPPIMGEMIAGLVIRRLAGIEGMPHQ